MFLKQASFKRNKRKRKEVGAITYALHQSGLGLFALSAGFACFTRRVAVEVVYHVHCKR